MSHSHVVIYLFFSEDVLPVEEVHDEIVNLLKSVQNFELKLEELCQLTQITSSPQNIHDICHFLETKLSSGFPGCKAYSFGSRVCGLAFPESDVDIFLDIGTVFILVICVIQWGEEEDTQKWRKTDQEEDAELGG